jgi:hypothetical protein
VKTLHLSLRCFIVRAKQASLRQSVKVVFDAPRVSDYLLAIADDHGSTGGGACNAKSEIPDSADQERRLTIQWTTDV